MINRLWAIIKALSLFSTFIAGFGSCCFGYMLITDSQLIGGSILLIAGLLSGCVFFYIGGEWSRRTGIDVDNN